MGTLVNGVNTKNCSPEVRKINIIGLFIGLECVAVTAGACVGAVYLLKFILKLLNV